MATKLNDESIESWLTRREGWSRDGDRLVKEYRFDSFRDSIVFVNRVATIADELDHHPDIDVRYDRVSLSLSSHDAGGITDRDLKLAERIDFATSAR
ncbi:MAG: 4a-hydroxytetrahydrobiopterin dehydratase [Gemmatimonadetes bacterium]|nr:MAG: 4a-hydroxytetrahydrobiopterin dehydratase [Gemmatimonadota bacterium]